MAHSEDETMRLVLDVVGEEGIERLEKSTRNYRGLLQALAESFRDGDLTAEEFETQQKKLSSELERQNRILQGLRAAQREAAEEARALADAEIAAADATVAAIAADQKAMLAADQVATSTVKQTQAERDREDAILDSVAAMAREAAAGRLAAQDAVAQQAILDGRASAIRRVGTASGDSLKRAQMGFVDLSRAAQDFAQGGFAAIVNNLEGIGRGLPAILQHPMAILKSVPAMLTLIGTAAIFAWPHVQKLFDTLSTRGLQGFNEELKRIEGTIKELSEKKGVTLIDLANLETAKRDLDELSQAQAAFNALKNASTNLQEKVAKRVKDVVIEQAGGSDEESGAANLANLIEQARKKEGTFFRGPENVGDLAKLDKARNRLRIGKEGYDAATTPDAQMAFATIIDQAEAEVKNLEAVMTAAARKAIGDLIGKAAKGIESARGEIAATYDRNEDIFKTGGVGAAPVEPGFRGGIELASAANIKAAEEQEKATKRSLAAQEQQKKDAEEQRRSDAALDQQVEDEAREAARAQAKKDAAGRREADRDAKEQVNLNHEANLAAQREFDVGRGFDPAARGANRGRGPLPGGTRAVAPVPIPTGPMAMPFAAGGVAFPVPSFGPVSSPRTAAPPIQAPDPGPKAVLNDPFRGLKGTQLRKAKRAARLRAEKEKEERRRRLLQTRNAARKPLQSTVIPKDEADGDRAGEGGQAGRLIREQAARDAARAQDQARRLERARTQDAARRAANDARFRKAVDAFQPSTPSVAPRPDTGFIERPLTPEDLHPAAAGPGSPKGPPRSAGPGQGQAQAGRAMLGTGEAMLGAMGEMLATEQMLINENKRLKQGFQQIASGARKSRVIGETRLPN